MKLDDFLKIRDKLTPTDKIVYLREKYEWEPDYRYYKVLLFYEPEVNPQGLFTWEWDFDEGEEYIEVLGVIDINDVQVPLNMKGAEDAIL